MIVLGCNALLIVCGIVHSFRVVSVSKHFKRYHQAHMAPGSAPHEEPTIVILIPLLREAPTVYGLLTWLDSLKYPAHKLRYVLITTEREYEMGYNSVNDTVQIIKSNIEHRKIAGDERYIHVHYPHTIGVKSDQLNHALGIIENDIPHMLNNETYIGVYDADSITPTNILLVLAKQSIADGYHNIYQQPTWYFKNHTSLPRNFSGFLAEGFAWLQTTFALCHEAYLLSEQAERPELTKMEYGIGHGLFVRWPFLKHIGFFPSPIEDTRLGQTASFLGEKMHLLPLFDTVEVAVGIRRQILQFSVWFTGVAFVVEDLRRAKLIGHVPLQRGLRLLSHRLYRNAVWICRPFLLFFAIIGAIMLGHPTLALITLVIYLYLPVFTLFVLRERFTPCVGVDAGNTGGAPSFFSLLLAPVEFLIMSLGPLLGLLRFVQHRLINRELHLPKTERHHHH